MMQGRDHTRQQLPGSRTTPPSKQQAASLPNRATHSHQQPAKSPGRANNLSAQLPPSPPQGLLAGKKRVRFAGVDAAISDDCQPCGAALQYGCSQQPVGTAAEQQASISTAALEATAAGAGPRAAQHPCSTQMAFPARAGRHPQHSLSRSTVHAAAAGPAQHALNTPKLPMTGSPAGAGHHPPQHGLSTVCTSAPSHPAGLPTPLQHHKPGPGSSTSMQPGLPAMQQLLQPAGGPMDALQGSSHALQPSKNQADHQHNMRHDLLLAPQSSHARSTALEALAIAFAMAEEGKVASTPENQQLAMTISAVLGSGALLADANTAQQLAELLCPATTTLAGMTFATAGPLHYRPVQYDFPPKWRPTESRPELHDAQLLSLSGLQTACQPLWPPATRAALLAAADDAASGPCNMFMPETGLLGFFWQGQGLLRQCLQNHVVLDPHSPLSPGKQLKQHIYSRAYMAEFLGSVYNLLQRGYPKEQSSAAAAPAAGTPDQAGLMPAQEELPAAAAASTSESSDMESSYQMLTDAMKSAEANLARELKAAPLLAAEGAAPAAAAATLARHHAGRAGRAHIMTKQVQQQAPHHKAALLILPEPLSDADAATLAAACRTAPGLARAEGPFQTNKRAGAYQTWPIAAPANTTKSFILSFCPEAGQLARLRREEASALQPLPIQVSTPGQLPAHGEGVLPEAMVVAADQLSSKSGLSAACSFIQIQPLRRPGHSGAESLWAVGLVLGRACTVPGGVAAGGLHGA